EGFLLNSTEEKSSLYLSTTAHFPQTLLYRSGRQTNTMGSVLGYPRSPARECNPRQASSLGTVRARSYQLYRVIDPRTCYRRAIHAGGLCSGHRKSLSCS